MSDNGQEPTGEKEPGQEPGSEPKTFDEVYVKTLRQEAAGYRIKLKEFETKQSEIDTANAETERLKLEEQNRFQELYEASQAKVTELEPLQTQVKEFIEQAKKRNETAVEKIPENMRGLVPDYGDDHQRLSVWLSDNMELLTDTPSPTSLDGGKGQGGGRQPESKDVPTLEQIKAQAIAYGVSWQHIAESYGLELQK